MLNFRPYSGASSGSIDVVVGICGANYYNYKHVTVTGSGGGPIVPLGMGKPSDDFSEAEFSVYPNPVKEDIFIRYTEDEQYKYDVRIIEMKTGKTVLTESCMDFNTNLKVGILQPGLYLMVVTVGGEYKTYKFIKK